MKRDVPATEAAGFADKRSYVCWDGREVLAGADWQARKLELWVRCKGRCEQKIGSGLLSCLHEADDPHHIIPRSKGRDDRLANLQALCRYHHNLLDKRVPRFGEGRAKESLK